MNSQLRERMILAALLLKILEPRLQQYGITLTTADLVDLIGGAVVVWHTVVAPILARFAVPSPQVQQAVNIPTVWVNPLGTPQSSVGGVYSNPQPPGAPAGAQK